VEPRETWRAWQAEAEATRGATQSFGQNDFAAFPSTLAFWSAPVLWRFGLGKGIRKRQKTAAVQNLAAVRSRPSAMIQK